MTRKVADVLEGEDGTEYSWPFQRRLRLLRACGWTPLVVDWAAVERAQSSWLLQALLRADTGPGVHRPLRRKARHSARERWRAAAVQEQRSAWVGLGVGVGVGVGVGLGLGLG